MDGSHGYDVSDEPLFRGYGGRLFLGVSLGWAIVVFGRQLLPPLLPTIIADLGITPFMAGVAVTVLWGARALSQFPGGRLADELSRKTVLVGGLAILVAGFAFLSMAVAYPMLVVAAATIGFGAGAYSVSTRTTVADIYTEKRGRAFGIQTSFNSLAGIGSAGGAIVILAVATWRGAFLPIAIALLFIALALHFRQRDRYVVKWVDLEITATARRLLDNKPLRRVIAAYVLSYLAWQGMITFLPAFLQAERGFSPALASAGFGLVFVIGALVGPAAGALADRFGKLRTGMGVIVSSIVGLSTMLLVDSVLLVGVSIVALALGFRSFFPVMQAYLMDTFATDSMAGDLGAGKSVWGAVGSLGPAYVGFVAGWHSYAAAFAGLIVCLVLSLGIIVVVEYGVLAE